MSRMLCLSLLIVVVAGGAHAAETVKLPEGFGLAAKYPGDIDIGSDTAVLLAADFEAGDVAALSKMWNSVGNKNERVISLPEGGPPASPGERCVQLVAKVPDNEGGHLYKKLPREVDLAFARFYVKFPEPTGYIHHFVHFGGYRPATEWPQGGAGEKPNGDERMTVGIEPFGNNGRAEAPGLWNFYPYWHEMKASTGNKYWGNSIQPARPLVVPRNEWQCIEIMMKCNTPDQRDGELALWLDGKLAMHVHPGTPRGDWTGMGFALKDGGTAFEGFSWRTSPELKINFFWLLHYVTETNQRRNRVADPAAPVTVQFDHIVVSEEYIGPIKPR